VPAETHSHTNPISREEVVALIRDQLSEILEIDPERVELTSAFVDDLGADALALIDLVEALEGELGERSVGFRIDDEDLQDLHTVGDAVDYILARIGT
jgi:acyl carrier protein